MLPDIVNADTSCFILLEKIDSIHLLKGTFSKVYTTPEVFLEFGNQLPEWVEIAEPAGDYSLTAGIIVDMGEASAIELALEFTKKGVKLFIVLDDLKARHYAISEGLNVVGTMGLVLMAKQQGVISQIKPFFELIKQTNFRLNDDLEKFLLKKAGEV